MMKIFKQKDLHNLTITRQGEEVSEVRFRNSYTAWLTLLVKFDQSAHPQFTPRSGSMLYKLYRQISFYLSIHKSIIEFVPW